MLEKCGFCGSLDNLDILMIRYCEKIAEKKIQGVDYQDLMNFIVDLFSLKMRIMMRNFEEYEESLIFNLLYIFQEK
jgi:hypothetical protein